MYFIGSKKMLNMFILDILKEHSDKEHPLTQKEIVKFLKICYGVDCDRRSIKNNILALKDSGYNISMGNGYYLASRDFDDAELRLLIDTVLFSKHLTKEQSTNLINKLRKLGNKYFSTKIPHIHNLPHMHHGDNKQLMDTITIINEAISRKKQIRFLYNTYKTDLKLYPKKDKHYLVNPYQLVSNNSFYYLVGNYDTYNNISHYRVDKITDISILDTPRKATEKVEGLEQGLNLPKHMAEHIYMFSGESINIQFLIEENFINDLVDWFGKNFTIIEHTDGKINIKVKCNAQAFFYWALQYGMYVEVLQPINLRNKITDAIELIHNKYHTK